jgi:hypothetical protein
VSIAAMTIDPAQLLRKLEPAIRPAAAPARAVDPQRPLEQRSFDELLTLVSAGGVDSGRPVSVRAGLALQPPLDEGQLGRLGRAVDTAAAEGSQRAVMLIDGRGLVADVAARSITDELTADAATVASVDAAVFVLGGDSDQTTPDATGRLAG